MPWRILLGNSSLKDPPENFQACGSEDEFVLRFSQGLINKSPRKITLLL